MSVKSIIANYIENEREFYVMSNCFAFNDMLACDNTKDEDGIYIVTKASFNPAIRHPTSFSHPAGTAASTSNGYQEIFIPYSQITGICTPTIDEDLQKLVETNHAEYLEKYVDNKTVQVCSPMGNNVNGVWQ